ncbi:Imidazoleglycerol-phosphate dehydratase [Chloroherpeton thalassium ATCC 35110]|uniref:Imidazoleglycerol-phosphate dehydratase n=1 Tax=Chloroherpeton thalassium (strain ATCC 35110 / GB-78) TaxID=517418 RepID=HIS7_CHLT3|nr:imidazoleglycerol-phosphate dehydratase HisB [Chloroherpeton thalassium]B3QTX2.1 RecName: Full=Imidazoleglycerol-phosphate dehydratase; Short=IGPD [Chloroherpeton thalassium ATCC 35110]ACF14320.1 Imidazoleglycerol-phosphate dehydratase [Chloroherpeton thalassium ATCC 35110]
MPKRRARVTRKTKETDIAIELVLDGNGKYEIQSGIRFLDHMLESFSKHSRIDIALTCTGDVDVDDHHSIEDIAIVLGSAISQALGDKRGIQRYGWAIIPMDESLARAAIDLSGRSYLFFDAVFDRPTVSDLSTEMVEHFFFSLAEHLKANIHLEILHGKNTHHKVEALFKSLAVAMREAVKITSNEVLSTKGVI